MISNAYPANTICSTHFLSAANKFANACNQHDLAGFEAVYHDATDFYAWVDFVNCIGPKPSTGFTGFTVILLPHDPDDPFCPVAHMHAFTDDEPVNISFCYDANEDLIFISGGMGEHISFDGNDLAAALDFLLTHGF